MKMVLSVERKAEAFIIISIALYGLFPVLANLAGHKMPPILFAALSNLVTAVIFFVYLAWRGELNQVLSRKTFWTLTALTILNIVLPFSFIYSGAKLTSGVNTALLLQMEVFFTFLICPYFFGERISRRHFLSALIILCGAITVLYKKSFFFNAGDLLIIAGVFFYPFGNYFAKKGLALTSPSVVLLFRSVLGGALLLGMSLLIEEYPQNFTEMLKINATTILANGIIVLGITKVFWFKGLRHLPITRAIALGTSEPAFNLFYAYLILSEIPTQQQFLGLTIIVVGLILSTTGTKKPIEAQPLAGL